jgi:hypothetical protein
MFFFYLIIIIAIRYLLVRTGQIIFELSFIFSLYLLFTAAKVYKKKETPRMEKRTEDFSHLSARIAFAKVLQL